MKIMVWKTHENGSKRLESREILLFEQQGSETTTMLGFFALAPVRKEMRAWMKKITNASD